METKNSSSHKTKFVRANELQGCSCFQCGVSQLSFLECAPCLLQVTMSKQIALIACMYDMNVLVA